MINLNVLYQFNEKYTPYAGVSITSLLENNKIIENITIYVLGENVSKASEKLILQQVKLYNRDIKFLDTQELVEKMRNLNIPEYRGSYATNMKMFAASFMDNTVDRLLYIDSDTVVCGELSNLMSIDMNSKPMAMVLDSLGKKHKKLVGLHKNDNYYNAGVILFDIAMWKKNKCTERIVEHVRKVRAHYMSPDQDLLNIVFRNEILMLDVQYNIQPIHFVYSYKVFSRFFGQYNYYSKTQISKALIEPKIVHMYRYLGEFPWHKDSLHPNTNIFDEYMSKSLWKDYEKKPTEQNNWVFQIEKKLYKLLPRKLFLFIFKINFDIFIWKSNSDSLKHKNNRNM